MALSLVRPSLKLAVNGLLPTVLLEQRQTVPGLNRTVPCDMERRVQEDGRLPPQRDLRLVHPPPPGSKPLSHNVLLMHNLHRRKHWIGDSKNPPALCLSLSDSKLGGAIHLNYRK